MTPHQQREKPENKKEKDIDAVKYVLTYINAFHKYSEELKQSLQEYPKKWKRIHLSCLRHNEYWASLQ